MARELTTSDLAPYHVTLNTAEGSQNRVITAAYATTEPGWLLLKDHNHRTVAQFHSDRVVMIERRDETGTGDACSDEDRIRDAMAAAEQYPGRLITR